MTERQRQTQSNENDQDAKNQDTAETSASTSAPIINNPLMHLMVVGFHHKKGCLVEYCYPPLDPGLIDLNDLCDTLSNADNSDKSPNEQPSSSSSSSSIRLPSIWQTLPSLAIPDGAHNFDADTIFFHLPDPNDWTKTVYCVARYQQIQTKLLLVKTPDMTRSSVQKSVVALLRIPVYGLIEYKLKILTRAYFKERDFSQVKLLEESYQNINQQINSPSIINSPEFFTGLSVRNLFTRFGSQVIVLFKLLLLEKKTIFITSPIRDLTSSILTICSLIPGLVEEGLTNSVIPYNVKTVGENLVLDRLIKEQRNIVSENISKSEYLTTNSDLDSDNDERSRKTFSNFDTDIGAVIVDDVNNKTQAIQNDAEKENIQDKREIFGDDQQQQHHEENEEDNLEKIISQPFIYYGLPLQIFACNSFCLPYFSISYFDVLINERVRSCLAGSSNHIFKRWENDIDVFVRDNQIEIDDTQLKRILSPTVEDARFMAYLVKAIVDNNDATSLDDDIFDGSQHEFYEGSEEWVRCHFKNYLLHMMRCSFLDESSREYRAFNPAFMSAWKSTHNYKVWSTGPYTGACFRDIDAQHPFTGNRLNNFRFKVSNFISNRQEYINQTFNTASKLVLSTARSTMSSWLSNLGSTIQTKGLISAAIRSNIQPQPQQQSGNNNQNSQTQETQRQQSRSENDSQTKDKISSSGSKGPQSATSSSDNFVYVPEEDETRV